MQFVKWILIYFGWEPENLTVVKVVKWGPHMQLAHKRDPDGIDYVQYIDNYTTNFSDFDGRLKWMTDEYAKELYGKTATYDGVRITVPEKS